MPLCAAAITTEATRYRDDVLDWLGVQREGYQRLSANDTAAEAAAANATEEAGGHAGEAADAAGAAEAAAEAAEGAAGGEL